MPVHLNHHVRHDSSHSQPARAGLGLLLGVIIGVVACGSGDESERPHLPPVRFSVPASVAGHLMVMNGTLAFLPCGEGPEAIAVVEGQGSSAAEAVNQLGGGGHPVPALVRIAGDTILEVRHAAPEGGACDRLPEAGDLIARGNEPFWHLRVAGDTAVLSTPEDQSGIARGAGRWSRPGDRSWRFDADGGAVVLELSETRCLDSMSAAWFPFRATLRWEGRLLEGCALEGSAATVPQER